MFFSETEGPWNYRGDIQGEVSIVWCSEPAFVQYLCGFHLEGARVSS